MINKNHFLLATLSTLLFTACSSNGTDIVNGNDKPAEIRFSTSMDVALTRAADGTGIQTTTLDNSATPAVFVYRDGTTVVTSGYGYINQAANSVSGGTLAYTSALYYPQDKDNVDVYLYSPYKSGATTLTAIPISVATDQSSKTSYLASDFVHGKTLNVAYNTTPINVSLVHDLCKIVLNIEGGTGASFKYGDITSVTLGETTINEIYTDATVDITNSSINSTTVTTGAKGVITLVDATTFTGVTTAADNTTPAAVACVIPVQTLNAVPLKVTIGTTVYSATLSSPDTDSDSSPDDLVAGNVYTYTVTVDTKGLNIKVNTITDWSSQSGGTISVQ